MNLKERYEVNTPNVIHQNFEDESVIVNLATGIYYSLDPVGSAIWDKIRHGVTAEDLVSYMTLKFVGNKNAIVESIDSFIDELKNERLIIVNQSSGTSLPGGFEEDSSQGKSEFKHPKLERFTDMQDLLLLDPIHEVDETGWPHTNPDDSIK